MFSPVGQVIYGTHYYSWKEWKQEMHQRIHQLEHVRQLYAIQTIEGAGQAIPADWFRTARTSESPQTADPSSLVWHLMSRGIRCCRDSAAAIGREVARNGIRLFHPSCLRRQTRLQPAQRATAFSRQDEVSHPHYYGVQLKDEHLKAEMTALSHTSILRVTPDKDELVHLVIQPNNDDGQGTIQIDTVNHVVYAYNPAPHVYQGWGKPDDFGDISCWLMIKMSWLTMVSLMKRRRKKGTDGDLQAGHRCLAHLQGKDWKGDGMDVGYLLTSRNQAVTNLNAENYMYGGLDFNSMMEYAADLWCERLHTIDVESRRIRQR